jgi:MFS family permease
MRIDRALLVLVSINILNFYDRQVAGALTEPLRREFQLSDTQVGMLTSVFTWLYALIGVPAGRMADRGSRKALLAAGMSVWSLMTAYTGMAASYTGLVVSRLGMAVGESVCAPAGMSWIGDLYPPAQRGKPLALFMLGVPLGFSASLLLSGRIAEWFGWRAAMMAAAAPALLLVPAVLVLREPERGITEGHRAGVEVHSAWRLLRIPTMWWIILSGGLFNFVMYTIAVFAPAFLSRVHQLSVAEAGAVTGVLVLGGVPAGILAGRWGDRMVVRRKNGRMAGAAALALAVFPVSLAAVMQPAGSLLPAAAMLGMTFALLNTYYSLVYPSIQDIVPPDQRGTAMALYFLAMYALGGSFGPLVTGRLSDLLAWRAAAEAGSTVMTETYKAAGLHQAMLVIPAAALALAAVLYAGSRTIQRDSRN